MKTLNPYDFGKTTLVEECQKVRIEDFMKIFRSHWKKAFIELELEILGLKISIIPSKTRFNGERLWFACPKCNKRAGVVFSHPITSDIGCRKCLGLNYSKRRYKGMAELTP